MVLYILAILTGVVVLVADQFTKVYILNNFEMGVSYDFLPGIMDIIHTHNDGAAWGMLSGYTWLLLSITIVVMLVFIALLLKYGLKDKIIFWAAILVLSGGLGNMIDRIFRGGKVIDFLHFEFWPTFPVFNIADCAIVIAAGLLIVYIIKSIVDEQNQRQSVVITAANETKDENNGDT